MKQEVYILGTPYEIVSDAEVEDKHKLYGNDGLAELYSKKLVVNLEHVVDDNNYEHSELYYRKVLRHEMIHAFFHESGLTQYADDEVLVDFLALQLDKMFNIMNQQTLDAYLRGLGFYTLHKEEE